MIRVSVTSVLVDDQEKARAFYTEKLGFVTKNDFAVSEDAKWLTVTSPGDPDGVEVLLEPDWNPSIAIEGRPAAKVWKKTLYDAGMPLTMFASDDVRAEYERLTGLGVRFTGEPTENDGVTTAVFDDTCGNYIMIASM